MNKYQCPICGRFDDDHRFATCDVAVESEDQPYDVRTDPLVPVIAEVLRRFSIPRTYAGDYYRDFAVRIIEAINE